MANFETAFKKVIAAEGGYVNDPHDAGGETYMGISRRANPTWKGWNLIDNIKKVYGTTNIDYNAKKSASLQQAVKERYKVAYWDIYNLDAVPNQKVANQLFDTTVNCGKTAAIKMVERVLGRAVTGRYSTDLMNELKKIKA